MKVAQEMAGIGGDVFYGRTELQSEFYKQLPAGWVSNRGREGMGEVEREGGRVGMGEGEREGGRERGNEGGRERGREGERE